MFEPGNSGTVPKYQLQPGSRFVFPVLHQRAIGHVTVWGGGWFPSAGRAVPAETGQKQVGVVAKGRFHSVRDEACLWHRGDVPRAGLCRRQWGKSLRCLQGCASQGHQPVPRHCLPAGQPRYVQGREKAKPKPVPWFCNVSSCRREKRRLKLCGCPVWTHQSL